MDPTTDGTGDPTLVVRPATREDLPAVLALLAEDAVSARVPPSTEVTPAVAAAFEELLASDRDLVVVGVLDGVVVGCFQLSTLRHLSHDGGRRAQVENVRVASHLRSRGIGEQLMRWAVDEARRRDCHLVQLTTNRRREAAHRFYERLGFEPSHLGMKLHLH